MKNKVIIFFLLILSYNVYSQSVSLSTNSVNLGGTVRVTWSGFSGSVNVRVYKGTSWWVDATTTGTSSGYIDLVTSGWEARNDYNVKVELKTNTSIYRNTGYFTVIGVSVNPQISVSPTSGTNGTTFQQPGTGFTPNGTATLYFTGPDGSSSIQKTVTSNGTYTNSWTCNLCPNGSYSYYAVDNSSGKTSSTVYFSTFTANPQVAVSPTTGTNGTTFQETGSGFTPNGIATLFFTGPDGSSSIQKTVASNGTYTNSWTCNLCPNGSYSYYAVDNSSGKTSSTVYFSTFTANPQVAVSPTTGTNGTTFQETGSGFTPNGIATLFFTGPDGSSSIQKTVASNGTYTNSWTCNLCPNGSYSYYAVDNSSGKTSSTVYFSTFTANPQVAVSPTTGTNGTTFQETGSGFTPNGTATLYFTGPDGSSSIQKTVTSNGTYTNSWTCNLCPNGSYSYYAVDNSSGKTSSTVYFSTFTANPQVAVSPTTGTNGTTFQETGSGFTPNGTATLYFTGPDGSSSIQETVASNGTFTNSWTCNLCPNGSYSYYAVDNSSGKTSSTVYFSTFTANPQVAVSPTTGTNGTTFQETGSGFTPNGTATLYFTGPDGSSSIQKTVVSNGTFTNSWTCNLCPSGSYSYYAVDNSSGKTSNTVSFSTTNSQVNLTAPIQNEIVLSPSFTFNWSSISNATSYELYVDNASGFGSPEVSPVTIQDLNTSTSFTLSANWLTPGYTYYWKVIAKTPNGDVPSTIGNFTYSPTPSSQPNWVPIYRTYHKTNIDHFYCTAPNHLETAVSSGFKYEKNEGFISLDPFQTANMKCVYRLYKENSVNPKASYHFYTTDDTERDQKIIDGLNYEGIIGYCYGTYQQNTVKLFHLELNKAAPDERIDHFYTTSEIEKNNAITKQSYNDKGFIGYVSLDGDQSTVPFTESQPQVGSGINPFNGSLSNVEKTSFSIPEGKIGLSFTHLYNSGAINFMTPYSPLGAGWNHNYIISLMVSGDMVIVFMPTEINVYDKGTLKPITRGIYNQLIKQTEKIYRIKLKNQTEYTFEMMYENDSTAVLTSITDRHNNIIRLIHDEYRRLVYVKTPTNRSLDFTYYPDEDKKYLIQSIKDPSNRTIKFDYDDNNNLIKFTDAKNQITNYDYGTTPFGLYLNSITYADGTKIINTFDATSKRLTSQNNISDQTANQTRISSVTANKVTVTDEKNKWVEMSYDVIGNITDLVTASGSGKYNYTDTTNPTKPTEITDGKGNVTTVNYNSMGDPLTINKPLSITHKYEWNSTNDLVKYTNPLNSITTFTYTNGNLTSISTPRGTTNMTYFSNGNINTVNDPLSQTITYSYDGYNNVKTISDILGNRTQYDYDLASRITKVTDANNQVTNYTFDENDLLRSTVDALTKTTQYSYDASNRLTAVTDARGNTSSMNFNITTGLLDYSTDQLGNRTNYTYFENGTLKSITNRNSLIINYAYDEINRLKTVTGSNINRTFTYDLNDNIEKIDDNNGSLVFIYDELNRLTSHTDFYNKQIQYAYDKAGNVIRRIYPEGKTVDYTYYADNLLFTVKDWGGRITTYTYRNDGSIDQMTLPNGTFTKYSYDSAGRLTGLQNKKSDGTIINSYAYTLDGVGNHTSVTSNEPLSSPPLTVANITYGYNNANRILNAGSTTFTHDLNGNMLKQIDGGATTVFTYDTENRLTDVNGSFNALYIYDAMGYRRSATRNGVSTRYVLDVNGSMENVLMETDASNVPLYYYIQGNGLLYRIKASDNSAQYYHYDSRGSAIAITDQNQNLTHKYAYDDFGKVTNSVEPVSDFNPYRYDGQYGVMYESSDLYFMRARYYKPELGRFISEDLIWSMNLYSYVDNNPVVYIDSEGLSKKLTSRQIKLKKEEIKLLEAESKRLEKEEKNLGNLQSFFEVIKVGSGIAGGLISTAIGIPNPVSIINDLGIIAYGAANADSHLTLTGCLSLPIDILTAGIGYSSNINPVNKIILTPLVLKKIGIDYVVDKSISFGINKAVNFTLK